MTVEALVERLGQRVNRRSFLVKLGIGTVASLVGLMGYTQTASAYSFACCNLCQAPSSSGATSCPQAWCWTCAYAGQTWRCCEHFNTGATCERSCTGIYKSSAECISNCDSSPQP